MNMKTYFKLTTTALLLISSSGLANQLDLSGLMNAEDFNINSAGNNSVIISNYSRVDNNFQSIEGGTNSSTMQFYDKLAEGGDAYIQDSLHNNQSGSYTTTNAIAPSVSSPQYFSNVINNSNSIVITGANVGN